MPQRLKLKVKDIKWLTKKVINLEFDLVEPKELDFLPGQHIGIIVDDGISRPYCMNSDPRDAKSIGITVSAGHDGVGSNFLKNLKIGDEVDGIGALGRLVLAEAHKDNILFVGTGTGMSPMISMLKEIENLQLKSKIRLYFGIRNKDNMLFEKELERFKGKLSNFDYEIVMSKPDDGWGGLVGYVDEHVKVDDPENTQAYVIGHGKMVVKVVEDLLEAGLKEEDIIS